MEWNSGPGETTGANPGEKPSGNLDPKEYQFQLYMHQAQYSKAHALACEVQDVLPDPKWRFKEALTLWIQGFGSEALQILDELISQDPLQPELLYITSVLLSDLGFYEEAKIRYQAASELDSVTFVANQNLIPFNPVLVSESVTFTKKLYENTMQRAELYWNSGMWKEVLDCLTLAKQQFPCAQVHHKLALFYLKDRRVASALEELEQAQKLQPRDQTTAVLKSVCMLLQHQPTQAYHQLAGLGFLTNPTGTERIIQQLAAQGL